MNKKTIITLLLALVAMTGLAQKHLPAFQYSKEPAVLSGQIIGNNQQITDVQNYCMIIYFPPLYVKKC
ncbi:hypothetical protein C7Y71_004205 [Pseudoprevotella muciniphila]|uniref:Uncharacterized protein n=1 Tax=Pseudoprevotella muciniphila TaxID=2133944 RepID=A0A5P8E5U7_9BACT|nr:hypothetical protein [Pseudoprevotella muciniphila]QFQ12280.1 hypothetical protein C7Y71_004205 [Pseudoprevotella muciniphila]